LQALWEGRRKLVRRNKLERPAFVQQSLVVVHFENEEVVIFCEF